MIDDGTVSSAGDAEGSRDPHGDTPGSRRVSEESAPEAPRLPRVRIGVIADAHGHLDPRVKRIFAGVDHIIAAGDTVDPEILTRLADIAPVTAVSGPSDGALADALPEETSGVAGGVSFAAGHASDRLLKRLSAGEIPTGTKDFMHDLVVWAGTHKPAVDFISGSLFLNPGTAGSPDPDDNDPTVALVEGQSGALTVRFVPLRRRAPQKPRTRKVFGFRGGLIPTVLEREIGTTRRKRREK